MRVFRLPSARACAQSTSHRSRVTLTFAVLFAALVCSLSPSQTAAQGGPGRWRTLANIGHDELVAGEHAAALAVLERAYEGAGVARPRDGVWRRLVLELAAARLCATDDVGGARDMLRVAYDAGLRSPPEAACRPVEMEALFTLVRIQAGDADSSPEETDVGRSTDENGEDETHPSEEPVATEVDTAATSTQDPLVPADSSASPSNPGPDEETPAPQGDSVDAAPVEALPPEEAPFEETPSDEEGDGGWWLEASALAGFGFVGEGLSADRARPDGLGDDSPWQNCDGRGEHCEVRVASAGFGSSLGMHLAGGVHLTPALSMGIGVRVQPAAGRGLMAGWLAEILVRGTVARGGPVRLEVQAMVGAGQIQFRPPQDGQDGPWARSGLAWVSASLLGAYAIDDRVELFLEATPRVSFPDILFVADVGLGLRVRSE